MSKQNIPYMRLRCQSNIFPFFYQSNSDVSSVDIEVIRTVLFLFLFYERYFKHLKHKQKHLSNFHQNNKPKNINKSTSSNFHLDNMLKKRSSK